MLRQSDEGSRRFALESVRLLFLINGGAVVVMLTLLGTLISSGRPADLESFGSAIGWFVTALLVLAFAMMLAYLLEVARTGLQSDEMRDGRGDKIAAMMIVFGRVLWVALLIMAGRAMFDGFDSGMDAMVALARSYPT